MGDHVAELLKNIKNKKTITIVVVIAIIIVATAVFVEKAEYLWGVANRIHSYIAVHTNIATKSDYEKDIAIDSPKKGSPRKIISFSELLFIKDPSTWDDAVMGPYSERKSASTYHLPTLDEATILYDYIKDNPQIVKDYNIQHGHYWTQQELDSEARTFNLYTGQSEYAAKNSLNFILYLKSDSEEERR